MNVTKNGCLRLVYQVGLPTFKVRLCRSVFVAQSFDCNLRRGCRLIPTWVQTVTSDYILPDVYRHVTVSWVLDMNPSGEEHPWHWRSQLLRVGSASVVDAALGDVLGF